MQFYSSGNETRIIPKQLKTLVNRWVNWVSGSYSWGLIRLSLVSEVWVHQLSQD